MANPTPKRCPKCQAWCECCGGVMENDALYDAYQCENEACAVTWEVDGEDFPAVYTFLVGADGVARDPLFCPEMN